MTGRRHQIALVASVVASVSLLAPGLMSQSRARHLPDVTVTARPLSYVGRAESAVDSAAMRESIALSLAEVLGYNSGIFVKDHGRATQATVAFRGTSASHTQVTWNGMRISSPMIGSTDFSMIPSYMVDGAAVLHGSSSLTDVGGGIGGLVRLTSDAAMATPIDGAGKFSGQYVQGVGSWRTFDQFARIDMRAGGVRANARVSYATSLNDFTFVNRDKKENIYDDNHNIIGQYNPKERNLSGAFSDLHALASLSYDCGGAGRVSADVWYLNTDRHLPLLTTDYSEHASRIVNRMRDHTLRAVAGWRRAGSQWGLAARAGYIHSWLAYDYKQPSTDGISTEYLTRARNRVDTWYGALSWKYYPSPQWYFTVDADVHHHAVESHDTAMPGNPVGYSHSRTEFSASASARWRPLPDLGVGAVVRHDIFGPGTFGFMPAIFAEYTIVPRMGLMAKASVSRNSRHPSLNDLYTVPGGNPDLDSEHGWTYDAGISMDCPVNGNVKLKGTANWFDSRISDWILWLPSPKGYYIPRNIPSVHAYGIESELGVEFVPGDDWRLTLSAHYTWSSSVNEASYIGGDGDKSVGKQLPYVPRHAASAIVRVGWRRWILMYKWQFYSERFTMSSNEHTLSGYLPPYSVSGMSLERPFEIGPVSCRGKLVVSNLFNASYQTILSRPMPGTGIEIFLSVAI